MVEIDKLFNQRFDALVNSLEIGRPAGSGGPGGAGRGRRPSPASPALSRVAYRSYAVHSGDALFVFSECPEPRCAKREGHSAGPSLRLCNSGYPTVVMRRVCGLFCQSGIARRPDGPACPWLTGARHLVRGCRIDHILTSGHADLRASQKALMFTTVMTAWRRYAAGVQNPAV